MKPLYFDYNATTPVHKEVVQAMLPYFTEKFGNPGSGHMHGLEARNGLEKARESLAGLINSEPEQLYFTSCATEANNLVLSGTLRPGDELIISAVEHPSVSQPAAELEKKGIILKIAPVDHSGRIDPDQVRELITSKTRLVSVMLANNEAGTIQPVAGLSAILASKDILLHTDAAQAAGKIPVDVAKLGVDFLSVAGHKMYAPKGVGALYARKPDTLLPLLYGGGQEKGIKPGTENVTHIVGLGRAAELAARDLEREAGRQKQLGARFLRKLPQTGTDFVLHAEDASRLPGTMSIGFGGYRAADILSGMVACSLSASAGAACHGDTQEMSQVLKAMGVKPHYGLGTIRFSWGRMTSEEDIDELLHRLEYIFHSFLS